jgi:hypothetical protein
MKDYFEWYHLPPDTKIRFVKMKLKGQARMWWNSVEEQLHRSHQRPILEWEEMKLRLQEKYLPVDYEETLFEELLAHKQNNTSVDDYTHKFHELSVRSRVSETERQTIAHFKVGLGDDIKRELLTVRLVGVDEAYQLALRVEQQLRGFLNRRTSTNWSNSNTKSFAQANKTTTHIVGERTPSHTPYSERGSQSHEENKGKMTMGARPERGRGECYRCGGCGHFTVVCPTKEQKPVLLCEEETNIPDITSGQDIHELAEDDALEERLDGSSLPLR